MKAAVQKSNIDSSFATHSTSNDVALSKGSHGPNDLQASNPFDLVKRQKRKRESKPSQPGRKSVKRPCINLNVDDGADLDIPIILSCLS